ncbi:MAG: ABC transporter ATP-binding protein [Anaerolineae bacterium]|nr:ABC transporter ATP-binding protein [Anaerolineae bacterium]
MSDSSADEALITAANLGKAFGFRPVLRGINLNIQRGSVVALLGPNGSGKTTLLRILSTLSKQSTGELTIGGWSLPKEAVAVRAQLGVVAHLPLLYDDMSAEENLHFFARLYGVQESSPRIAAILERVGLGKRGRDVVRTFSRGMQQRLALARAMLHDPAILLLDEPYTGLDVNGALLLDALIAEWKTAGKTIIASLHEPARAAALCDQAVILKQGRVIYAGEMVNSDQLIALIAEGT